MRVLLHAGTHKTGTTSFQFLMNRSEEVLNRNGILYPRVSDWAQHSKLAWMLQSGEKEKFASLVSQVMSYAKEQKFHTVLLSGEDFENCLLDLHFAKSLEEIFLANGATQLDWVFVIRDKFEYMLSLYCELSKHRVCVDFYEMSRSVLKGNFFSVSNSNYSYFFSFDVKERSRLLSETVEGKVIKFGYADFNHDFPGSALLRGLIKDPSDIAFLENVANSSVRLNESDPLSIVEKRYAREAVGSHHYFQGTSSELQALVEILAEQRLRTTEVLIPIMRDHYLSQKQNKEPLGL